MSKASIDESAIVREAAFYQAWQDTAAGLALPAPCPSVKALEKDLGAVVAEAADPGQIVCPAEHPGAGLEDELNRVAAILKVFAATAAPPEAFDGGSELERRGVKTIQRLAASEYTRAAGLTPAPAEKVVASCLEVVSQLSAEPENAGAAVRGDVFAQNTLTHGAHWIMTDPFGYRGHVGIDAGYWSGSARFGEDIFTRADGVAARLSLDPYQVRMMALLGTSFRLGVSAHYGWWLEERTPGLVAALLKDPQDNL